MSQLFYLEEVSKRLRKSAMRMILYLFFGIVLGYHCLRLFCSFY
jgi:hypothetical protein